MGKHPAARDYFQLGSDAPLVSAFKGWVDNGYRKFLASGYNGTGFHSWRFWARGDRKGHIACGIGRDSSDGLGRPYPFLSIGIGTLPGWENQWDLLPCALEDIWGQIEYLAAKRLKDVEDMKEGLRLLKAPDTRWSEWKMSKSEAQRCGMFGEGNVRSALTRELESGTGRLKEQGDLFVELGAKAFQEQSALINLWHFGLKSKLGGVPNAVFVGGGPARTYLAVFTRALAPEDFVRLWSV